MSDPSRTMLSRLVADPAHGPLPALLLALTLLAGVVDAASFLGLGHVFVANMTGNVVVVGFAVAGASGFSLVGSLVALVGFLAGAGVGGLAYARLGDHRGRLVRAVTGAELALLVIALVVAVVARPHLGAGARDAMVALTALCFGAQTAAARELAVFDLSTTVLSRTLSAIAADRAQPGAFALVLRLLAVGAMLGGAAVGGLLVLHASLAAALGVAVALVAAVAAAAHLGSRAPAAWHDPR